MTTVAGDDTRQMIQALSQAGVDRQTLALLLEHQIDLHSAWDFLDQGGTLQELREQLMPKRTPERTNEWRDDLELADAEAAPEPPPRAERRSWHAQQQERLAQQRQAEEERLQRQRAAAEQYRPRTRGVYMELDWYTESIQFLASGGILFLAWMVIRTDGFFTLQSVGLFQPAGVQWTWLDQVVIWPPFALYEMFLIPLIITAIQATCFPTRQDISPAQRLIGSVVSGINWLTSGIGVGLLLWTWGVPVMFGPTNQDWGWLMLVCGWLVLLLGAVIGGLCLAFPGEWLLKDTLPRLAIQIRGLWDVLYHNVRVFFASEPPWGIMTTLLSKGVFLVVLVGWLQIVPGTLVFSPWGLTWGFVGVVALGLVIAIGLAALASWGMALAAPDQTPKKRAQTR